MFNFNKITIIVFLFIIFSLDGFATSKLKSNINLNIPEYVISKNKFILNKVDERYYLSRSIHVKFKDQAITRFSKKNELSNFLRKEFKITNFNEAEYSFKNNLNEQLLSNDKFGLSRIVTLNFSEDIDPYEMSIQLMKNDLVEYASPIFIRYQNKVTVNDPYQTQQYALELLKLGDAWEITKGDTNIIIAIIDSGTDINHEDLKDNIYINRKEIPNNGIDDDGNGKIDDVNGWDFVGNITYQDLMQGKFKEDNNPINNGNFHGTHVAGCASAVTNNAKGIASPGYNCRIMPLKCAADNPNLGAGILRGYEAILFAAQNGATVINCSWGGPGASPAEQDIINAATELGSIIVAASGNDGAFLDVYDQYPSNYDNVISVGASNSIDQVANFTNYGNQVAVYAPGQQIYSTMPNNSYSRQDGTSFASPIVAGLVGLIKSIHPDWNTKKIFHQLRSTSDKLNNVGNFQYLFIGRANAFKAVIYNNSKYPDMTVPGIYAENLNIMNQNKALNLNGTNKLKVDLVNYLSTADNLTVTITPLDNYINVKNTLFNIAKIETDNSRQIEIEIDLLPNCPWYEGFAQILLKYESFGYIDYQVLNLPIKIQSDNIFSKFASLPIAYQILFYGADAPKKDNLWAVAQSQAVGSFLYYQNGTSYSLNPLSNEPTYCVYAFNEAKAIIGTSPENGNAKIQISTNSGKNWTSVNVNNLTPFINAIHFWDDNNGIFLGDPKNNIWGIAKTNNGGLSWTLIENVPPPLNTETGYVESIAIYGDYIWFGTSQGRVFYSNNRGQTWNVSKTIIGTSLSKMSFMDNKKGFALYNVGSGQTALTYIAYTTDGGDTWKTGIHDFNKSGIRPSDIHCVPDVGKVVILASNNDVYESDDDGATWKPVLTKRMDGVTLGFGINDGPKVRLWSMGMSGVGYLDFTLKPLSERKEISTISDNPFNFGEIKVGSSKISKVEIKNSGNVDLNIENVIVVFPDNSDTTEFKLMNQPLNILKPSEVMPLNLVFRPKSIGKKTAILKVYSNSEPKELNIELVGYGIDASNVYLELDNDIIDISPIPASKFLNINLINNNLNLLEYKILDINGRECFDGKINSNLFSINLNNLSNGMYYILFISKEKVYYKNFIKQ